MAKKNIYFFILCFVLFLVYPAYFYFGDQFSNEDIGIIIINSNLENYRIIPENKGGIDTPCLKILGCKKNINSNDE